MLASQNTVQGAGVIAILVKSHGRSTLAHFFTSLVLYSGHAAKQVIMQNDRDQFVYCN